MKKSGKGGQVTLTFIVETDGTASSPTVVRSSNPNFEQPAIDAILQWEFKPGIKDGMPVRSRVQIPIVFRP